MLTERWPLSEQVRPRLAPHEVFRTLGRLELIRGRGSESETAGEVTNQGNYTPEDRRKRNPRGNEVAGRRDSLPRDERCEGTSTWTEGKTPTKSLARDRRIPRQHEELLGSLCPSRRIPAWTCSCRIGQKCPAGPRDQREARRQGEVLAQQAYAATPY
jgi:hypothetical protein